MITVQFAGSNMEPIQFDADNFVLDGQFVLLTNDGLNVAAVFANRVEFIKKWPNEAPQPAVAPPTAADRPPRSFMPRFGTPLPRGR